jgi:O-antigen ligase
MLQDSLRKLCDRIALGGAAWLLTFPIVAIGGVTYWSRALIELTAAALAAAWSVRILLSQHSHRRPRMHWTLVSGSGALLLLLSLPLLPLPPAAVRWLSPQAFDLYTTALPGWPGRAPFAEVFAAAGSSAPSLGSVLPFGTLFRFPDAWRPLSLVPYQSWTTLMMGASFLVLGATVAFYPWHHELRALMVLTTAVIVVAVCEAVYAFVQQANGGDRILWFACPAHATCTGTYLNRNHFAGLLEMALPLLVARALLAWRAQPGDLGAAHGEDGWLRRSVHLLAQLAEPAIGRATSLWCLALLLVVALAASGSRSAFFATLLAFALTIRGRRRATTARGRAVVFAALGLGAGLWLLFPQVRDRFGTGDIARLAIAADTTDMVRAFPVFGVGIGNFGSAFPLYRARTIASWAYGVDVDHAHDDYLEWLSETGLLAACLAFALLLALTRSVLAVSRRPLPPREAVLFWGFATGATALLLHSFTDYNLHVPANALVLSFLVGGLIRLARRSVEPPADSGRHRLTSRSRMVAAVALLLSVTWGAGVWQRWVAESMFRRVYPDNALRSLMTPPEELAASSALGAVQQAALRLPDAPAVQLGLARHPGVSTTASTVAYVQSLWGDPVQPRALFDLTKTIETSPATSGAPGILYDLLDRAVVLGRYDPTLRLDVVDWYVQRWGTLSPAVRDHAVKVADAAFSLTADLPGSGSRRRRTLEDYERVAGAGQAANARSAVPLASAVTVRQ